MKKSSQRNTFRESIGVALPRQRALVASQAAEVDGWKVLSLMLAMALAALILLSWRPIVRQSTDASPVGESVVIQGATSADSRLQMTAPADHWQVTEPSSSFQQTRESSQQTEPASSFQETQSGYSLQGFSIQ